MAHMYPAVFPNDSKSSGERKVYEFFKTYAPADWYVLHSFRLPLHQKVVFGEADFVVIAPKYGIYVLEIKSGGVGFDGTYWHFINRYGEENVKQRGPFQQARDGMFELERKITERLGIGYGRMNILYGYGVIFTDESNFPVSSLIEDEPWRLKQNSDGNNYCNFIEKLYYNFSKELIGLGKTVPACLSHEIAAKIANTLRPIVECIKPLKSFIDESENEIITLTEEQYSCLDDIELNDRMVVTGGAGTGKTLLAFEEATRDVEKGLNIGFFCYNKNLAEYLKRNFKDCKFPIHSIHSYMMKICGNIFTESEIDENFFSTILPQYAIEVVKEKNIYFDKIIIDEFQDLCTSSYLNFIDAILKDGLFDGKFTFYGDFAGQAIFLQNASLDPLKQMTYFARKNLTLNCRNTIYIGQEMINISGFAGNGYRLKITGEPVDYFICETEDDAKDKLYESLKTLKKKGFKSSSIVILSPKIRNNSIVGNLDKDKYIIGDYGENCSAYIAMFSTIQAFKGLESEIIILIDIDSYSNDKLMYIALSRARSKLIVLESPRASRERKKKLLSR